MLTFAATVVVAAVLGYFLRSALHYCVVVLVALQRLVCWNHFLLNILHLLGHLGLIILAPQLDYCVSGLRLERLVDQRLVAADLIVVLLHVVAAHLAPTF